MQPGDFRVCFETVSRTVLRPVKAQYAILATSTALSATAWAVLRWLGAGRLLTIGAAVLTAFFTLGLLDLLVSRIELTPAALRIIELHRRRSIPRTEIVSAKADGGSVFLQLRNGSWLKLPDTGESSTGVLNTVRAWMGAPS